ncbi:hypothetical protein G3A43_06705 [Paraburkholderia aspalathi]|nr:hypothetical protein [Paraburkholderia aspalathi]MBK3779940.1 hypothetical protein [Paraburkholderia aspalathi]
MWAKTAMTGVLTALCAHASAMCMATAPVSPESPYDYYVALSKALTTTREARDEAAKALQRGVTAQQSAVALLTQLKTSQLDYACAQQYIEGYMKSKNEGIQVSSAGIWTSLQTLQGLEQSVEQNITDMLNGKRVPEGEQVQQAADLNVKFNDAWQTLMLGVATTSHSAPHFTDDHLDGMTLSPAQRADVIRRFKPLGPVGPTTENTPTLEVAVGMLLDYLKNKRLKSFGTGPAQPG